MARELVSMMTAVDQSGFSATIPAMSWARKVVGTGGARKSEQVFGGGGGASSAEPGTTTGGGFWPMSG